MSLISELNGLEDAIWNCAYTAMFEAHKENLLEGEDAAIALKAHAQLNDAAVKFSAKFADKFAPALSQAIYNYILQIQIDLTPKSGLTAATGGPVTGFSSTVSKEIMVS